MPSKTNTQYLQSPSLGKNLVSNKINVDMIEEKKNATTLVIVIFSCSFTSLASLDLIRVRTTDGIINALPSTFTGRTDVFFLIVKNPC